MSSFPIPYRLDFSNLVVDDIIIFCVAVLTAITINCGAQAYMANLLGDFREDEDRLHFNAFLSIDVKGIICFFLAGFGWSKKVDIDASNFSKPRLFMIISRLAGPAANFLLANIVGSIVWIMARYEIEDRVFTMVFAVNLCVAIYSLLPIPPLAGASIITFLFPRINKKLQIIFNQSGPFILLGIFLIERINNIKILSFLDPVVSSVFYFIKG
ncbi:Site-2 protease family protein [Candidatus Magnetomoraceae bacterium gMMP-15]